MASVKENPQNIIQNTTYVYLVLDEEYHPKYPEYHPIILSILSDFGFWILEITSGCSGADWIISFG